MLVLDPTSITAPEGLKGAAERADEVLELKFAVIEAVHRLEADSNRIPLKNQVSAVLVDGSRMSLLALELAGATWKFGRYNFDTHAQLF